MRNVKYKIKNLVYNCNYKVVYFCKSKIYHMNFESLHSQYKQKALSGRYITLLDITPLLQQLSVEFNLEIAGYSVLNNPIYKLKIGSGKVRILLWSQMHGNESTTTKALFDFINLISQSIVNDEKLKAKFNDALDDLKDKITKIGN